MERKRTGRLLAAFVVALVATLGLVLGMGTKAYAVSTTWSTDTHISADTTLRDGLGITADITVTIDEDKTLTVERGVEAANKTLTVAGKGTLVVTGIDATDGSVYALNGNDGFVGGIKVDGPTVRITGGKGGSAASGSSDERNGDPGGDGGSAVKGNVEVISGSITVTGGKGGSGGNCWRDATQAEGGKPGKAGTGVNGNVIVSGGSITVTGGSGGNSGNAIMEFPEKGGTGGTGVSGTVTVNGGLITATGGKGGVRGTSTGSRDKGDDGDGGSAIGNTITLNKGTAILSGGEKGGTDGNAAVGKAITGTIAGNGKAQESEDNASWTDVSGTTSEKQYVKVEYLHGHDFTYAVNNSTVTATCSAEGCDLPPSAPGGTDHVATLTIAAPLHTLVGDDKSAAAVITDENKIQGEAEVKYYTKNGDAYEGETTTPPTDAGDYKASITLGEGTGAVTASVTYSIATPYPIWVGGKQVTSANMGDVLEDGTVSFTPANGDTPATLTLNGANITAGEESSSLIYCDFKEGERSDPSDSVSPPLSIVLVGDNTVSNSNTSFGINIEGPATISGSGSLTTHTKAYGIYSMGSLEIKSGTIDAECTSTYRNAISSDTVVISGGTVTATATGNNSYGISGASSVDITGGEVTAIGPKAGIYGPVKNSIVGTGWTNTAGTEGETAIEASTTEQDLKSYKKVHFLQKGTQTITAADVTVTYGDTDKKVTATTDGDGAISYAVKDGSEDYIDVDATTGALTVKKVPADGKAYVTVTAAETARYEQATKDVTVTVKAPTPTGTNEMYRLYNPNSGEHFFTSNKAERDNVKAAGWTYEGVGWVAPADGAPVYRLYNENGGEHHYTTSKNEHDVLVGLGWKDEGIGWRTAGSDGVPIYRQYNPNAFANNHNFTTSTNERDTLLGLGWKDENVAWYGARVLK